MEQGESGESGSSLSFFSMRLGGREAGSDLFRIVVAERLKKTFCVFFVLCL